MTIDSDKLNKAIPRLEREQNIWLSTVRADGRPHLIPIWFVWHGDRIWICTPSGTQKLMNIQHNPRVALALEDGSSPVIIEGRAVPHSDLATREKLNPAFMQKFEWDIVHDQDEDWVLIEIIPAKVLMW